MPDINNRRHDIDAIRTIALGLLIYYHIVLSYEPWSPWVGFIASPVRLPLLWEATQILNIWRIPILFAVSGMGFAFASRKRDSRRLFADRAFRLGVPLTFGILVMVPLTNFLLARFYDQPYGYFPNPGYLWFLANLLLYALLLLPLAAWFRKHPENRLIRLWRRIFSRSWLLPMLAFLPIAEVLALQPESYAGYALSVHGLALGLIWFTQGFLLVSAGEPVKSAIERARWFTLAVAASLFITRSTIFEINLNIPVLIAVESTGWILAVFGFAGKHIRRPSGALKYLSKAVYPVYILHMPIQLAISFFLFATKMPAVVTLPILLIGTTGTALLIYHFVLRNLKPLHPLFGMAGLPGLSSDMAGEKQQKG
jgi:glucan biosynthesis protein C